MRLIPTAIHGFLDYLLGIVMIATPYVLHFERRPETEVCFVMGAVLIIYSLITRDQCGLVPAIPVTKHLYLDIIGGIVLAASPWIFNFADRVWIPHVVLGVVEIGTAVLTGLAAHEVPSTGSSMRL